MKLTTTNAHGSDRKVQHEVGCALDRALRRIETPRDRPKITSFDISSGRFIIFSDLHRGGRDAADDFQCCEAAYHAALAYYLELGHTLILLGDVEELWEEDPETILTSYRETYQLEARFHQKNRYIRVWGNHDDNWRYQDQVAKHLQLLYGQPSLSVSEGFSLEAIDQSKQPLGRILFLHGHQGDWKSDRLAWLSKPIVRYLWRPIQRRFHISLNTPAKDWTLRDTYNVAMARWAEQKSGLILIAGHTHQPVFESRPHEAQLCEWVYDLNLLAAKSANTPDHTKALDAARAEWLEVDARRQQEAVPVCLMKKICYFNTGCGCFYDGHITGLEITDRNIQLVRWPDQMDKPQPQILARQSLLTVLQDCK